MLTEDKILKAIDDRAIELIELAEDIYKNAEPGFREFRTSEIVCSVLEGLGLEVQKDLAVTGIKARQGRKNAPTIAIIGELDGIMCAKHPYANPQNGISHACGHHNQLMAMIGAAFALTIPEIRDELGGNVVFFAVPSEEFTDLDYKDKLMNEGKIRYGGGKSELIRLGEFDDINISLFHHLHMVQTDVDILLGNNSTNGFVCKMIQYTGKASHAAIAPHDGINALNAATVGLNALSLQRETFKDSDHVRIHAIYCKGGSMVNVIPEDVLLEVQVRAKYMPAMLDASHKTNRSFEAGAHAIGANIDIKDYPGYLPVLELAPPKAMIEAGLKLKDEYSVANVDLTVHNPGSTDVGDLAHIMPTIGFTTGGFIGNLHGANFEITDKYKAYVMPAKIMALTAYNMLKNNAEEAYNIISSFPQHLTKAEYMEYMESFLKDKGES